MASLIASNVEAITPGLGYFPRPMFTQQCQQGINFFPYSDDKLADLAEDADNFSEETTDYDYEESVRQVNYSTQMPKTPCQHAVFPDGAMPLAALMMKWTGAL